jgi:GT2 family glycosyltransferase
MTHKISAIIPFKGKIRMTMQLVAELLVDFSRLAAEQAQRIILIDNGSTPDERSLLTDLLAGSDMVEVVESAGDCGINAMWEQGLGMIREDSPSGTLDDHLVFVLNNDVQIIQSLIPMIEEMDALSFFAAISPSYDDRPQVARRVNAYECLANGNSDRDKCGGAGFAFLIRGRWIEEHQYRFPETLKWWFGDNHLLDTILDTQCGWGISGSSKVIHLNGGSQTATEEYREYVQGRGEIYERDAQEAKRLGIRIDWQGR